MDAALTQIRQSARAHGAERLYTPGEIEADFETSYSAGGIPLNDETIAGIMDAAGELAVEIPQFTGHLKAEREKAGT